MTSTTKYPKTQKKEINVMLKKAYESGWRFKGKKHIKCFSPDGITIVTVCSTKASHRVIEDIKSNFREGGLNL